jgi:hypothetical protein
MHPNGIDIVWDAPVENEDFKVTVRYLPFHWRVSEIFDIY